MNPDLMLGLINENYTYEKIIFDKKHDTLKSPTSHAQGYARYRGEGYDFHIVPYSNVAGKYGYVYVESEARDSSGAASWQFTLQVPQTPIRFWDVSPNRGTYNPNFNHPSGIQVYGDYLLVPVIPFMEANGKFYDAAIIYLNDLSPLKAAVPKAPTLVKELMQIPQVNGGSLSCIGIIDHKGQLMLGIMTDNNFDIYSTSNKPTSIADARFSDTPTRVYTCKATSSAKRHYQGIGFLVGQLDDVYLMGFDTRGGAANEDWVDMYQLTADGKWLGGGVIEPIVTKHLIGGEGAHFKYGGNVEVVSDSEYLIYSIEQYYTGGGLRISMFSKR